MLGRKIESPAGVREQVGGGSLLIVSEICYELFSRGKRYILKYK
jgi:hypothetical protein